MHKLIIVGHQSSNFQDTFKLLQSYGVNEAKPSRREGYTPLEISSIICKAHGVDETLATKSLESNFQQIDVGNVWHGLALDLMLGNIDSKVWGWADTKSIYLLNFWRDLDPEITFVLVYSNPEDVLLNCGREANLSAEDLELAIDQWVSYNEAILYFYNRNKDRCYLVHSQQVNEPSNRYLLEISTKINASLLEGVSNHQLINKKDSFIEAESLESSINNVPVQNKANLTELVPENVPYQSDLQEKPLSVFLSKLIIQQHPKLTQLYEDLQSFANFPLNNNLSGYQKQTFSHSAFDAWLEMTSYLNKLIQAEEEVIAITKHNRDLMSELIKLDEVPQLLQEKDQLLVQLHQVQEQLEQFYIDNKNLKTNEATFQAQLKVLDETQSKLEKLQAEQKKLDSLPELEQKNSALLSQLHHVHEQLEQTFVDNKNLKTNETTYKAQLKELDEAQFQLKKLQAEHKKLAMLPELEQENSVLLSQLHHVQEELERYYLENQAYKERNSKLKVLEYSAEQIKTHLAYSLGGVMIKNSKTLLGAILLPVTLWRETSRYKQEKLQKPKYEKRSLTDYEKNQVAAVKNHLSYRLGSTLLANIRNPLNWLVLPYKLWREINIYKKMRS